MTKAIRSGSAHHQQSRQIRVIGFIKVSEAVPSHLSSSLKTSFLVTSELSKSKSESFGQLSPTKSRCSSVKFLGGAEHIYLKYVKTHPNNLVNFFFFSQKYIYVRNNIKHFNKYNQPKTIRREVPHCQSNVINPFINIPWTLATFKLK